MALVVGLTGRPRLEVDGVAVADAGLGSFGRVALAYLATERHRPVQRDELADVLWGDALPRTWASALRTHVTKLRAALRAAGLPADEVLVSRAGCYQLHLPPDTVVDIEVARDSLDNARHLLAVGEAPLAQQMAADVATVAGRQFLPGAEGEWVEQRQREVRDLRLEALEVLAEAAGAVGAWAVAVRAGEEAISAEPFRESAYVQVMAAHAGAGNRGEALQAYERCRRTLAEELGVDPSPATEAAYLALLGAEPASSSAPVPELDGRRAALPPELRGPEPFAFVNRVAEQQVLLAVCDGTTRGPPRFALVAGEPGSGKTRLVAQVARALHERGAVVLAGRCDEGLTVPYQPFAQALRAAVDAEAPENVIGSLGPFPGELARILPDLSMRLPGLPPPIHADPETERYHLFEAVEGWLAALAADRGVVFVIDDLQWAAGPTLQLLRHLARARSPMSLNIIGIYRDTDLDRQHPLVDLITELGREGTGTRMTLAGLDPAGVGGLLEQAGGRPLDATGRALAAAIHRETEGNPFFAGELVRHLAEMGRLRSSDGAWIAHRDIGEMGVPEGVRQVVEHRVARLPSKSATALTAAAVIGSEFDLPLLALVVGLDEDSALAAVEAAVAARLVVENADEAGHFQFAHAIVRATLTGGIGRTRRLRLHRTIGQAIEALHPDAFDAQLPALAHHFCAAAPLGDRQKAATYALEAATAAAISLAFGEACALARLGLGALEDRTDADERRRCELLIAFADSSMEDQPTKTAALEAGAIARRLRSPVLLAQAAVAYSEGGTAGVPNDVASRLCQDALELLGDDQPALRSMVLGAWAIYRSVDEGLGAAVDDLSRESVACARAALVAGRPAPTDDGRLVLWELTRAGERHGVLAQALVTRGAVLVSSEQFDDRLGVVAELESIELATDAFSSFDMLRNRAPLRLELGDVDGFRADLDEVARRLDRLPPIPPIAAMWQMWRGMLALLEGRFAEVEGHATSMLELAGDEPNVINSYAGQLFCLAREQGRHGELHELLTTTIEDFPGLAIARTMLALTLAETGQPGPAQALLDELAQDKFVQVSRDSTWTGSLTYLAETAAALDDPSASTLYELLAPHAGHLAVLSWGVACLGAVDRYLGMLAAVAGRHQEAVAHFEAATDLEERVGAPPLLARSSYWFGRTQLGSARVEDRAQGTELLTESASTAKRLGMRLLQRQAEELLMAAKRA